MMWSRLILPPYSVQQINHKPLTNYRFTFRRSVGLKVPHQKFISLQPTPEICSILFCKRCVHRLIRVKLQNFLEAFIAQNTSINVADSKYYKMGKTSSSRLILTIRTDLCKKSFPRARINDNLKRKNDGQINDNTENTTTFKNNNEREIRCGCSQNKVCRQ